MNTKMITGEAEHTPTQLPGYDGGDDNPKPHTPATTARLDVDSLVSDFLGALETYFPAERAEETKAEHLPPGIFEREALAREMHRELTLQTKSEAVPTEMPSPSAVDTDLDPALREIEAQPRLNMIPFIVAREAAATQANNVLVEEESTVPEAKTAPMIPEVKTVAVPPEVITAPVARKEPVVQPVQNQESGFGKDKKPPAASQPVWPVFEETKAPEGLLTPSNPWTSLLDLIWAKRKLAIVIALIILALGCVVGYFFLKATPRSNSTGRVPSATVPVGVSASLSPQPHSIQSATAKDSKPPAIATAPAPARAAATPQNTAIAPPRAFEGNSTGMKPATPVQNATPQSKGGESIAADPPEQAPPVNTNPQVGMTAGTPPAAQVSELPAAVRSAEPSATKTDSEAPPIEAPKAPIPPPAKSDSDVPPVETAKVTVAAPPPAANPAEGKDAKANVPASKIDSSPLASQAQPLVKAAPVYPGAAAKMNISGSVDVRVEIDAKGNVTKATAINGQLLLRPAAEEALMKWKFRPATLRGLNIASDAVITIQFVR